MRGREPPLPPPFPWALTSSHARAARCCPIQNWVGLALKWYSPLLSLEMVTGSRFETTIRRFSSAMVMMQIRGRGSLEAGWGLCAGWKRARVAQRQVRQESFLAGRGPTRTTRARSRDGRRKERWVFRVWSRRRTRFPSFLFLSSLQRARRGSSEAWSGHPRSDVVGNSPRRLHLPYDDDHLPRSSRSCKRQRMQRPMVWPGSRTGNLSARKGLPRAGTAPHMSERHARIHRGPEPLFVLGLSSKLSHPHLACIRIR